MNTVKLSFIFLFAAMTFNSCGGQSNNHHQMKSDEQLIKASVSVGLGTLDISFDMPVPFFRTENDTIPVDTLTFEKSKTGEWLYKTNRLKLNPYRMSGGDTDKRAREHISMGLIRFPPRLSFRVLEADENYYRVVVDESAFETVVIRKDPDYLEWLGDTGSYYQVLPALDYWGDIKGYYFYETWEQLLLRAEFEEFSDNYALYENTKEKKIFEQTNHKFLPYKVTEVRDDWINVKKSVSHEEYFEGIENPEGWVKWKTDTEILVNITEYTVE
jgi:hypothetical protein